MENGNCGVLHCGGNNFRHGATVQAINKVIGNRVWRIEWYQLGAHDVPEIAVGTH